MNANTMLLEIEEKLGEAEIEMLVAVWNTVFPVEEYIKEETIFNDDLLIDEVKEIILDGICDYDAKQLLRVYNTVTGKNISFEDLLYDDSL